MKFIELKKSLNESLSSVYLIEGEDRLVVKMAQEMIEKKVDLNFPDLNRIVIDNDKITPNEIIEIALGYPMGDEKKVLIIKNFATKQDIGVLENFLKQSLDYLVIVFVSFAPNEATKKITKLATYVDCNKLDDNVIKRWIVSKLSSQNIEIEEGALQKFITYCSSNLTRIESELSKLMSLGEKLITIKMVDEYVVPDKDYQIYELQNYIAKDDKVKAMDIVNTMLLFEKNSVGLIQYLYQAFRKLLLISLSKETDEELGIALNCKPYAIKMNRMMLTKFSPKRLKHINEQLSDLEYKIKSGKFNADGSVVIALCQILLEK